MQTYESVTTWQGEPEWEIEVTVKGFPTAYAAATFGNEQAIELIRIPRTNYLTLVNSIGKCYKIEQNQVVVRKIKPESASSRIVSGDDFYTVDINIENFAAIDGLNNGFACLAYGVAVDGQAIAIDSLLGC